MWGFGCLAPATYAARIERLRTREERAAALAQVPDHLRDLVQRQVIADLEVLRNWSRRIRSGLPVSAVPSRIVDAFAALGLPLE